MSMAGPSASARLNASQVGTVDAPERHNPLEAEQHAVARLELDLAVPVDGAGNPQGRSDEDLCGGSRRRARRRRVARIHEGPVVEHRPPTCSRRTRPMAGSQLLKFCTEPSAADIAQRLGVDPIAVGYVREPVGTDDVSTVDVNIDGAITDSAGASMPASARCPCPPAPSLAKVPRVTIVRSAPGPFEASAEAVARRHAEAVARRHAEAVARRHAEAVARRHAEAMARVLVRRAPGRWPTTSQRRSTWSMAAVSGCARTPPANRRSAAAVTPCRNSRR
jgi:hypothetical protein